MFSRILSCFYFRQLFWVTRPRCHVSRDLLDKVKRMLVTVVVEGLAFRCCGLGGPPNECWFAIIEIWRGLETSHGSYCSTVSQMNSEVTICSQTNRRMRLTGTVVSALVTLATAVLTVTMPNGFHRLLLVASGQEMSM